MTLDTQDAEFIGKREAFCRNNCNFTIHPVQTELVQADDCEDNPGKSTETLIKGCLLCKSCGFIDDLEFK